MTPFKLLHTAEARPGMLNRLSAEAVQDYSNQPC